MADLFWQEWEFVEDELLWSHYEEDHPFRWCFEVFKDLDSVNSDQVDAEMKLDFSGKFSEEYRKSFLHHKNTAKIIEAGWSYINNYSLNDKNRDSQRWVFEDEIYLCSSYDKITPVFYEKKFDIYRRYHVTLKLVNGKYCFDALDFQFI